MLQKQVAAELNIGTTNYNKLENGNREPSVKELQQLSVLFDMTVDQILNFEGELPKEISLEDKTEMEQFKLLQQLDEDDKLRYSPFTRPLNWKVKTNIFVFSSF